MDVFAESAYHYDPAASAAIGLQQQLRVNPFNTTYWVSWPTAENNYVNPQSWWNTAAIIIHNLEPAG